MKHDRQIEKFLKGFVRSNLDTERNQDWFSQRFIGHGIPQDLLESEDMENNSFPMLFLLDDTAAEFYRIVTELRNDRTTEYLRDKELEEKFWFLCCDVATRRKLYQKSEELKSRIHRFLEDLCQPIQEYEAFIKILHLKPQQIRSFPVWNSTIRVFTKEELLDAGFRFIQHSQDELLQEFAETPLMLIREQGNNPKLVIERVREKAEFSLKVLQTYLTRSLSINDNHVLFDISEHIILRDINTPEKIALHWKRKRIPYGLHYTQQLHDEYISQINSQLSHMDAYPLKIQAAVKHAIYWIGTAVEHGDYDQKVIALCTAIEAFLTTYDDKKKGETLTYRMILLFLEFQDHFPDPFKFLWWYNLRSKVIHGAELFICSQTDYANLLWTVRETLSFFMEFIEHYHCKSIHEVARTLEHSEKVAQLIKWLEKRSQNDNSGYAKKIRMALIEATTEHRGKEKAE